MCPGAHASRIWTGCAKGPVTASGKSMVTALDRVAEIAGFGLGSFNLGAVPRRRMVELARYGMAGKAPLLRRHPQARKLSVPTRGRSPVVARGHRRGFSTPSDAGALLDH